MSGDEEDTFIPLDEPANLEVMAKVRALSSSRTQEINQERQLNAAAHVLGGSEAILVIAGDTAANTAALGNFYVTDFTWPDRKLVTWRKVNTAIANAISHGDRGGRGASCCVGPEETKVWSELVGWERVFYVTNRTDNPFSHLSRGSLQKTQSSLHDYRSSKRVFEMNGSCARMQCTGRLCNSTSFALVENETADESALNEALQAPSKGTLGHGGYGSVAEDGDDVDEASDDGEGDGMPDLDDGGDNRDETDSHGVVTKLTPQNCSGGGDGGSGGGAEACAGAGGAGLLSTSTVPVISDEAVPTCLECGSPARPNIALRSDSRWNRQPVDEGRQNYEDWLRTLPRECKLTILDLDGANLDEEAEDLREKAQFGFPKCTIVELNPGHKEGGAEKTTRTVEVRAKANQALMRKLHEQTFIEKARMMAGLNSEIHGELIDGEEDEEQTTEEEMDDDSDDDYETEEQEGNDLPEICVPAAKPPVPPPRPHSLAATAGSAVKIKALEQESNDLRAEVRRLEIRVEAAAAAARGLEH